MVVGLSKFLTAKKKFFNMKKVTAIGSFVVTAIILLAGCAYPPISSAQQLKYENGVPGYYGSAAECSWAHANGHSCFHPIQPQGQLKYENGVPGYYGSPGECAWAHSNGRSCFHPLQGQLKYENGVPGYYGSPEECAWAHSNGHSCFHPIQ